MIPVCYVCSPFIMLKILPNPNSIAANTDTGSWWVLGITSFWLSSDMVLLNGPEKNAVTMYK